ncbi:MAG: cyclic nucleotide-binding domain-containing protein [Deltaproteobacteria bacterium]|nr:cyclic nucleotide-binding domain-containing protein [Deltaproteobacteria bacterium]
MTDVDLAKFSCFADLSDEQRECFAAEIRALDLEPEEAALREGDEADGMILLASGRLRLERSSPPLRAEVGPGTTLGGLSLLVPGRREMSAFAATPCRLLWLPRAGYRRLADDAPHAACRFVEHLITDLVAIVRPEIPRLLSASVDPLAGEE